MYKKQLYFNTVNAMSETLDFIDVRTAIFGGDYPYDRKEPQSIAEN